MKKNILYVSLIIMITGGMLIGLTGCTSKITVETDGENDVHINTNIIQKNDNEENKTTNESKEKNTISDKNQNNANTNEKIENNSKVNLTVSELNEIGNFLNSEENNLPFLRINYTSPEDLVKQIANGSSENCISYAINEIRYTIAASKYTVEPSLDQINLKYVGDTGAHLISEENLIKLFKEKINYQYTKDEIRKVLKSLYNKNVDMYEFTVSDSNLMKVIIKNGYKENGKYYINVELAPYGDNVENNENATAEVVLEKANNKYTFYSCQNSAKKDPIVIDNVSGMTKQEIAKKAYSKYIEEMSKETGYEIKNYKIEKVEITSLEEIKKAFPTIEDYYSNVQDKDIFAIVTYSIEPEDNINDSFWLPANGDIEGNWIKNKEANIYLVENNGTYTIEESGTEW